MATFGNCGSASGTAGGMALADLRGWIITRDFTISTWIRISQLGWGIFFPFAGSCNFKYIVYRKGANYQSGEIIYLSDEYTTSGSGKITINTSISILLAPGTYWFGIVICEKEGLSCGWANGSGGTTAFLAYKTFSTCTPQIGSLYGQAEGSTSGNTPRFCITYETVSEAELTMTSDPNYISFQVTAPDLFGREYTLGTPYSSTFPLGSTLTLEAPEFTSLGYSFEEEIGPSSIVVTSSPYSIRWHDKVFLANGYFWVFWTDTDDKLYYKNSPDGTNWSNPVEVRATNYEYGESAGIYYDDSYFHFNIKDGSEIYFRLGRPESNGSLTWISPSWQIIHDAYCPGEEAPLILTDHSYCFSPDGGALTVWHYGNTPFFVDLEMKYTKDTHDITQDGIWSGQVCPPGTIADFQFRGNMSLNLPQGKFLVLAVYGDQTIKSFLWDNGWSSEEEITETGTVIQYLAGEENWAYSAIEETSGVIHLTYLNTNYEVRYCRRNIDGFWKPERVLFTGSRKDHDTRIVIDQETGDLYVFIAHAPITDHIGLIHYLAEKDVWLPMIDLIDASATGLSTPIGSFWGGLINASRKVANRRINLLYIINNPTGGHQIKFYSLKITPSSIYKFREWDDSSTQPIREVILSSDYTMYFDKGKLLTDSLILSPWIRIKRSGQTGFVLIPLLAKQVTKDPFKEELGILDSFIRKIILLKKENLAFSIAFGPFFIAKLLSENLKMTPLTGLTLKKIFTETLGLTSLLVGIGTIPVLQRIVVYLKGLYHVTVKVKTKRTIVSLKEKITN